MKSFSGFIISLLLVVSTQTLHGEAKPDCTWHLQTQVRFLASDAGYTPFFLRHLQYGNVPFKNPAIQASAWLKKSYDPQKTWDFRYDLEGSAWLGAQSDGVLTQAHLAGRWKKWELFAGRKREVYGLGDTSLTSGFYAWSGNALPIPKIQFGTYDFIDFAKGHLGIFMTYAHGWLDNQGPVKHGMLHQKTLYGRIGKRGALVQFFGGVNHQVMWSGYSLDGNGQIETQFGSGWNTYFYVVSLSKKRDKILIDPNAPATESGYQFGAHLGSIDFMLVLQPTWGKIQLYRQSAWETGRIVSLTHINDGLQGLSLKLPKPGKISRINLEYLYTANMGSYLSGLSKMLKTIDPHANEIESYFNGTHGGWQYHGKGLGTPFNVFNKESITEEGYFYSYNAVKAYTLGMEGQLKPGTQYRLQIAQSYHALTPLPFTKRQAAEFLPQTSIGINLYKTWKEQGQWHFQLGYDQGERLQGSLGIGLGLRWLVQ